MNETQLRDRFSAKPANHLRRQTRIDQKDNEQQAVFTRAEMIHLTDHYVCARCGGPLRFKKAQADFGVDMWLVFCHAHNDAPFFISKLARQYRQTQAHEEYFAVSRALRINQVDGFLRRVKSTPLRVCSLLASSCILAVNPSFT